MNKSKRIEYINLNYNNMSNHLYFNHDDSFEVTIEGIDFICIKLKPLKITAVSRLVSLKF